MCAWPAGQPISPEPASRSKSTSQAVPTDTTGHFIISAPPGATLVFSHIGYLRTELTVTGPAPISITLEKVASTLEQVTVSYGNKPETGYHRLREQSGCE